MRLSNTMMSTLQRLISGESVAASSLREDFACQLRDEGLLTVRQHGSRRTYCAIDSRALKEYLAARYEQFGYFEVHAGDGDTTRSSQAASTGNSKIVPVRACPGFPVNSCGCIPCRLGGQDIAINPPEGSFMFITDWKSFGIPEDVTVIGIENMENFRLIRRQEVFFDDYLRSAGAGGVHRVVFVSRYPQSTDLRQWLQSIPNRYIHFGDFDLAGINIFLTEFYQYLGDRATFLIPADIDTRLREGSVKRYNDQYARFGNISTQIASLQTLIDLINKYHRCYDQEGYISVE